MANDASDPGRIERDLDQTRSRLGSHLTELQDRLSPGQVIDDLMAYFRGSDGAEFGRNLAGSVRDNPLPAALTGIGLAWLMASNPNPKPNPANGGSASYRGQDTFDARLRTAERRVSRQPDEAEHAYAARLDNARGQALGIAREPSDTDQSFGVRVKEAMSKGRQAASDGAHSLRDTAGDAAGAVGGALSSAGGMAQSAAQRVGGALSQGGQSAGQAGGNLVTSVTENPMLLGALGLAAGALLGSLLPQSENEEDLLGGVAGQARSTARGLTDTAMERGGNVAQAVLDAGKDSAQQRGLTEGKSAGGMVDAALGGDLAKDAKTVAQEALKAGDKAIHEQVLGQGKPS